MLFSRANLTFFVRHITAFAAGCFVGFGGILSASVGFDIGGQAAWDQGNGIARFLAGAVGFPFSILMVANTGVGAWTGDLIPMSRAWFGKKRNNSFASVLRYAILTWLGSMAGAGTLALLAYGCDLPACIPCIGIAEHKLLIGPLETFFRGVGGASLITLAVFQANRNRDMLGKLIGIWFCISTYVIVDFEHVLASMFFMTAAKLSGATFTIMDMLKFFVPSTLGNIVGGALVTGFGLYSIPKKNKKEDDASELLLAMRSRLAELEAKQQGYLFYISKRYHFFSFFEYFIVFHCSCPYHDALFLLFPLKLSNLQRSAQRNLCTPSRTRRF